MVGIEVIRPAYFFVPFKMVGIEVIRPAYFFGPLKNIWHRA